MAIQFIFFCKSQMEKFYKMSMLQKKKKKKKKTRNGAIIAYKTAKIA